MPLRVISSPSKKMRPESSGSSRLTQRSSVLLPLPLGPMIDEHLARSRRSGRSRRGRRCRRSSCGRPRAERRRRHAPDRHCPRRLPPRSRPSPSDTLHRRGTRIRTDFTAFPRFAQRACPSLDRGTRRSRRLPRNEGGQRAGNGHDDSCRCRGHPGACDPARLAGCHGRTRPLLSPSTRPAHAAGFRRPHARRRPVVDSYRRLADVFHDVLSEQSLDALLERIADTLAELVPYDALHDLRGGRGSASSCPCSRASEWADEILSDALPVRRGDHRLGRRASRARAREPGAPRPARPHRSRARRDEPEALIVVPLDRARRAEGRAEHLPARRRRVASPTRSSSSRSASATPPRSRSTTPRSARGSSTRRRPTR